MSRQRSKEGGSASRSRVRGAWILVVVLVSLASPALSRGESEVGSPESFFFIQMADTQFGMFAKPMLFSYLGLPWNDDKFEQETRLFEKAIETANRLRPAFVVVCGDLINTPGHAAQAAEFKRIGRQLSPEIPLYLVAGNHDIGNEPTPELLEWYRATFGRDWYAFRHAGVHGIVLNSPIIHHPERVVRVTEEQLAWLKAELDEALREGATQILVFQHHPLFLETPDEEDGYFNIPLETRKVYLDLFQQYGVKAVFAGHYHRNSQGRAGAMEMVTTGPVGKPLGDDPSGFRLVRVVGGRIEHQYYDLDAVPDTARESE